jgi:signal transduction histidine kinase
MSKAVPAHPDIDDIDAVLSILSRPDDAELVQLVELAARICEAKAAGITILRGDSYHLPVTYGIEPLVCPADDTFCAYTMSTDGVFCIEDATADARFAEIGWVDGTLATARFYASAAVYTPSGQMVGRLCVIDSSTKTLTPLQLRSLETLALSVTKLIELRLLRSERPLLPAVEEKQSAASVVSQLAAELSHDMRVPLSSIVASLEMLEEELGTSPETAVAMLLERSTRAADRLARMLDYNMDAGSTRDQINRTDVDLDAMVGQLRLDSTVLLEVANATIESTDLPVVRADPLGIYSVLQNLVTNSVKFARPGVPVMVHISAQHTEGGWRITVSDNGIGIPEERRAGIFALFSRGGGDVVGHGIGLATVARIIAAHGGRAGARTAPSGGAEIWFELPEETPPR